jgi:hypothetical protein
MSAFVSRDQQCRTCAYPHWRAACEKPTFIRHILPVSNTRHQYDPSTRVRHAWCDQTLAPLGPLPIDANDLGPWRKRLPTIKDLDKALSATAVSRHRVASTERLCTETFFDKSLSYNSLRKCFFNELHVHRSRVRYVGLRLPSASVTSRRWFDFRAISRYECQLWV